MHPFEEVLSVSKEEITILLQSLGKIEWFDFLLNPRRLRGSDFLMRWSQGVWSEHRLKDKNGHILPYVKFEGGQLQITNEALKELEGLQ